MFLRSVGDGRVLVGGLVLLIAGVVGVGTWDPSTEGGTSATSSEREPTKRTLRTVPDEGGPFIFYTTTGPEGTELYALDIGAARLLPRPMALPPDGITWQSFQGTPGTMTIGLQGGGVALVSRGKGLANDVFGSGDLVVAAAVSPDDAWVAIASIEEGSENKVVIERHSLVGSRPPKPLTKLVTSSDPYGGALHLFWNDESSLTVMDECHCDGGPGHATTYRLSVAGGLRPLAFMGDRGSWHVGTQAGAGRFVFDDVGRVDCFESENACTNVPHRLTVADVNARSLLRVASRRGRPFFLPIISPDGSIVATGSGTGGVEFYDVHRGRLVASAFHAAPHFAPVAWLDERRVLAVATSVDLVDEHETGQLILLTLDAENDVSMRILARGVSLDFVGWLR